MFTLDLLGRKGRPRYGGPLKKVAKIEKIGEHGVRFTFNDARPRVAADHRPACRSLPKHAIDPDSVRQDDAEADDRQRPLHGCGGEAGEASIFKRNPDYWGKDLPTKRGVDNYDQITIEYFLDANAMFEAFKKGLIDVFLEENSGRWTHDYDFPAAMRGDWSRRSAPGCRPACSASS